MALFLAAAGKAGGRFNLTIRGASRASGLKALGCREAAERSSRTALGSPPGGVQS
jgi:hypothetical protein